MRQAPRSIVRYLVLGLALALFAPASTAFADARSDARAHYQAGVKAYGGGDYKAAIREFSQAQSLAPADLNNYNLALCYDKLGDPEPAIQYYKAYLEKVPGTDKRTEIEASVKRLESAAKSVATKKADEDRKAEEARKAIEAKKAEEARKAEEAAKRAQEDEARAPKKPDVPVIGPTIEDKTPGVGSTGTPSSGETQTTGDAQLDRVHQININEIRDQRVGGAGSGIRDNKRGPGAAVGTTGEPAGGEVAPPAGTDPSAAANPSAPAPTGKDGTAMTDPGDKPKPTPVYKKWWFWAVVGVSAYVVYSIATDDSKNNNVEGRTMLPMGPRASQPSGLTLMRW